jgi:hypothetical protein
MLSNPLKIKTEMQLTSDSKTVRLANSEYDRLLDLYNEKEKEYLENPVIKEELETTGGITIRTVQRALGVSEGEAAFIVRQLDKKHGDEKKRVDYKKSQEVPETDEYYYHVTLKSKVRSILSKGLRPDSTPMFSNYTGHSSGKIFLCEKNGISFWKESVENHAFHNTGGKPKLAVLCILKENVSQVFDDTVGTVDSRAGAYFTTKTIPGSDIQVVT